MTASEDPAARPAGQDVDTAIRWFRDNPGSAYLCDAVAGDEGRHAATVVRAVLAAGPDEHLVNAAAPAMRKLLTRVARGEFSVDDAVDILHDWPNRAALAGTRPAAEPGYERIADAIAAACEAAALDIDLYRVDAYCESARVDQWLTLAQVLDKAGLIDWAAFGAAAARSAGDDTAPPAGLGRNEIAAPDDACGRCSHRADQHDSTGWCLKRCACEAFTPAAGPRASGAGDDTAPPADETMPDLLAALQASIDRARAGRAAAGPRAGDTTPGVEGAVHRLRVAYGTGEFITADVAAVIAELDRLRPDAAALRAAGNDLADAADVQFHGAGEFGPLVDERRAWRAAAGPPATEGGEQA